MLLLVLLIKYVYIQIYNHFIFFKKYQKHFDVSLEKTEKDSFQKYSFLLSFLLLTSSVVADASVWERLHWNVVRFSTTIVRSADLFQENAPILNCTPMCEERGSQHHWNTLPRRGVVVLSKEFTQVLLQDLLLSRLLFGRALSMKVWLQRLRYYL